MILDDIESYKKPIDICETDIDEAGLHSQEVGMGLRQMYNDRLVFYGGMRTGPAPANLIRSKFMVFDRKSAEEKNEKIENHQVGFVELFVDSKGTVDGIVNIELSKNMRRSGLGREIIKSLVDSDFVSNPLKVYDIQKKAVPFWRKMDTEFYRSSDFQKPAQNVSKLPAGTPLYGLIHS